MVNVVLLVKDRPRLTEQCLKTLYENTPEDQFNLTILWDGGTNDETLNVLEFYGKKANTKLVILVDSIGIVGWLRNVGASASERYFGRGDYLVQCDNDIAFLPNWLPKMITVMQSQAPPAILGGYRHPYHGVNAEHVGWQETDAVAGYMHFMKWITWDTMGPYDDHAKGVCQSEDFKMCQDIKRLGGRVGYIHPPVILNCGITNSEGKPAVGSEQFIRVPGYIYE